MSKVLLGKTTDVGRDLGELVAGEVEFYESCDVTE